jgi:hypothetical protein
MSLLKSREGWYALQVRSFVNIVPSEQTLFFSSEGGYDRIAVKLFNELNVDCYYVCDSNSDQISNFDSTSLSTTLKERDLLSL